MKHLGGDLDIHCGGIDNAFPHHTNEIAQSESYLGHKWCNYWMHVHHLNTGSGKMSKSKGEFLTVSLLEEKGYDPLVYRFFCMQSHYRKNLVFSWENLDNARIAYDKLVGRVADLKNDGEIDADAFAEGKKRFTDALDNDLNTSLAVTALYDVFKLNTNDKTKLALVEDFEKVLDLGLVAAAAKLNSEKKEENAEQNADVPAELLAYINEKIEARRNAKKAKDFAAADAIRDELLEKGITLLDTREGTKFTIS
jgi:cysteinyl-tRNA synthetase